MVPGVALGLLPRKVDADMLFAPTNRPPLVVAFPPAVAVGVLVALPKTPDAAGLLASLNRPPPVAGDAPVVPAPPNDDAAAVVAPPPPKGEGVAGFAVFPLFPAGFTNKPPPLAGVMDVLPKSVCAGVDEEAGPDVGVLPKKLDMIGARLVRRAGCES